MHLLPRHWACSRLRLVSIYQRNSRIRKFILRSPYALYVLPCSLRNLKIEEAIDEVVELISSSLKVQEVINFRAS